MSRTKRRPAYWAKNEPKTYHYAPAERNEFFHGYDKLSRRITHQKRWDEADVTTTTHKIRKEGKRIASILNDKKVEDVD